MKMRDRLRRELHAVHGTLRFYAGILERLASFARDQQGEFIFFTVQEVG